MTKNEIHSAIPHSPDELELIIRAQHGDKDARDSLIEKNTWIVNNIVNTKYSKWLRWLQLSSVVESNDLKQEGLIGLLIAIEKYDPDKFDTKFSTYAVYWIERFVGNAFYKYTHCVSMPRYLVRLSMRVKAERDRFFERTGSYPSLEYLSEILNVKPPNIEEALFIHQYVSSLNEPLDSNENLTLEDMLCDQTINIEIQVEEHIVSSIIHHMLKAYLDPFEKAVIFLRYGFYAYGKQYTIEQTARALKVTVSSVRQAEKRAIKKLQKHRLECV